MCCSWLSPEYWETAGHPEAWGAIIGAVLAALATVISVIIAAILTYRYSRKHGVKSQNTAIKVDRLKRRIDALENVWGLLAYMSQQRSQSTIIYWKHDKKNQKEKKYLFHFHNLEQFYLVKVSEAFYPRHAGLHLPESIRDQVFNYLHSVAVLYFKHKDQPDIEKNTLFEIEKPELAEKLHEIYHCLNSEIKKELENCYQQLLEE